MDYITSLYNTLETAYTLPGLLLMAAILILLTVQCYYWLGCYSHIHGYRARKRKTAGDGSLPQISVVVVVRDELQYVLETLPAVLTQEYPCFEVVVVDMASEAEVSEALGILQLSYSHLHVTKLVQQEQRFPITNKMALNVGIKAVANPCLVMTTTEARPVSPKWLTLMAKGFVSGKVVIGYCGIEPGKGITNRLMRAGRLNMSVRYLSAAIRGKTYRGISQNMGYTSDLYFGLKGFDHLSLDAGDDDLFIQRIAGRDNVSVVMNPNATIRQTVWGNAGDWFRRQMRYRATWKYYPRQVKNYIEWDTWSRGLLFACCLTAILCLPFEIRIAAGAALILRLAMVEFQLWRICRRLGERGLGWIYVVYDLFSPLYALALWAAGIFSPRSQWK